jgi:hypothetical protein
MHSLQFICKSFFIAKQFFQQIFIPVLNNAHWTVYCINKVYKQVEILDPQNSQQKDDKNRYHTTISIQICGRFNNVFQMFDGSSFPDISNLTFPYGSVWDCSSSRNFFGVGGAGNH